PPGCRSPRPCRLRCPSNDGGRPAAVAQSARMDSARLLASDRFAAALGARLVVDEPDRVVVEMTVSETHLDESGEVSSGALFALADCAMSLISNAEVRSEERRVGKESRPWWATCPLTRTRATTAVSPSQPLLRSAVL